MFCRFTQALCQTDKELLDSARAPTADAAAPPPPRIIQHAPTPHVLVSPVLNRDLHPPDSPRALTALARRSMDSPLSFPTLSNAAKRSDTKRHARESRANEGKRLRHSPARRKRNRGDDSLSTVNPRAEDTPNPVEVMRYVGMVDMPNNGALGAMYANDEAGLATAIGELRGALDLSGDTIGCLDMEWGPGRGNVPKERRGAWQWPSLLQLAVRGARALLVDLREIVRDKRDLDPRKLVCISERGDELRTGPREGGEPPVLGKEALVLDCVQLGHDTVDAVHTFLTKAKPGKRMKSERGANALETKGSRQLSRA